MISTNSVCFNVDNPKIQTQYRERNNYKVEYDPNGNQDLCVIYFTSHALYFPNDEDVFIERVVQKDVYEWYNTRHLNAGKHIFVRDVFKQWYLKGINGSINSPDLLLRFLKHQTEGMKIVTVGASAGGYAAILMGCMLGAEKVIAFNAQINLNKELQSSKECENALLHRLKDTEARKYYDLNDFMLSETDIFYIHSSMSEWDKIQCDLIRRSSNIHIIPIKSSLHGVPVPKAILKEFISSKNDALLNFVGRQNRPVKIMATISVSKTVAFYIKTYAKIIKKRLCH